MVLVRMLVAPATWATMEKAATSRALVSWRMQRQPRSVMEMAFVTSRRFSVSATLVILSPGLVHLTPTLDR